MRAAFMGAAATIALALSGCWILGGPPPAFVADRAALPACGEETSSHGETRNVAARQCLFDAYMAGSAAEFIVTESSVEGDPVTRITRVLGPGAVQVFVDATRDRFGSGRWEELRCSGLEPSDGNMVFVEDGCVIVEH